MYIIKQYHNEARREALNDLTKPYADALYDKYFEMAGEQDRFSDTTWPEQKSGNKYGAVSNQIWIKLPEDDVEGGEAMFHAVAKPRTVSLELSTLNPTSGRYETSFKSVYTLSALERIGSPEKAADLLYKANPWIRLILEREKWHPGKQARRESSNDLTKSYAKAIQKKYFDMAGKEKCFSDRYWLDQKNGTMDTGSPYQIWLKMPDGGDAIFLATNKPRTVQLEVRPLDPQSGKYLSTFTKTFNVAQLQELGSPEEAAEKIYSKYPLDAIRIPFE